MTLVVVLTQFLGIIPVIHAQTVPPAQQSEYKAFPLPTPFSHYETFKPETSGVPLLLELAKGLDPETQKILLTFVLSSGLLNVGSTIDLNSPDIKALLSMAEAAGITQASILPKEQALALLKQVNWTPWRPLLLELMVHQSQVPDMIPAQWGPVWYPIIHDFLLYFLDHLPQDRLLEKLVDLAYLPPNSPRGAYLIAFVSKAPSLQKLGQILARNPELPPEYQAALQELENGIHTMNRDELVQFITNDVGKANMEKFQVEFADQIAAEASVGAVIRATIMPPGSPSKEEAVCKVVKPYVLVNMPQELAILDGLAEYFTKEHEYYHLGTIPLVEMFRDISKSLADEIEIVDEQQNLVRARQYYLKNKNIVVPEFYPAISSKHVTFMQYIEGEKITNAFKGDPEKRAIMAKRLYDVMTVDVIFAGNKVAIFHGDPHAGNVYHVTGNPKNPYQIALLDWGLYGEFPRPDRLALMQLILGVQLQDAKRLHNNVGALLENGLPESPEKLARIDAIIADVIQPKVGRTSFDALEELLLNLIEEGYATKFSLNLFIKSQLTIAGILVQLDPTLDQDQYQMKRIRSMVKHEIPKRLLFTLWFPAWNSRSYRSMLSNGDVMAARKIGKKTKKPEPAKTTGQSLYNAPDPLGIHSQNQSTQIGIAGNYPSIQLDLR